VFLLSVTKIFVSWSFSWQLRKTQGDPENLFSHMCTPFSSVPFWILQLCLLSVYFEDCITEYWFFKDLDRIKQKNEGKSSWTYDYFNQIINETKSVFLQHLSIPGNEFQSWMVTRDMCFYKHCVLNVIFISIYPWRMCILNYRPMYQMPSILNMMHYK